MAGYFSNVGHYCLVIELVEEDKRIIIKLGELIDQGRRAGNGEDGQGLKKMG